MLDLPIDVANPANLNAAELQGCIAWYMALPGLAGGARLHNLMELPGDVTKGKNHGTLTNGPTWVPSSRPGGFGALSFDGTDDYVNLPNLSASISHPLTVMCWFRSTFAASLQSIIGFGNAAVDNIILGYRGDLSPKRVYAGHRNSSNQITDDASLVVTGEWQHAAAVYSSLSSAQAFLNGIGGVANTSSIGSEPSITSYRISSNAFGNYFTGNIDDVRIYNRALSTRQITALYTDSRNGYRNTLNRIRRYWPGIVVGGGGGNRRRRILCGA